MGQARFIATGPVPVIVKETLAPFGPVQVAPATDEPTLLSLMDGTIGLVVRGVAYISARIIEAGRQLRVIARSGVGCDNVDVVAATARGIPVIYTPGAAARAVAEGAMAMVLALVKGIPILDRRLKEGDWEAREEGIVGDLAGARLGIVGLGRIGRQLARLSKPFDVRLLAYDPNVEKDLAEQAGAELVALDELLSQSDVIVLCAPLTEETRGIVNVRTLALVKPGAILVNVGRGALVESPDILFEALEARRLAAVGLDVYPKEPPDIAHPLFALPNVLCTPHVMGLSAEASRRTSAMMSEGMVAVLEGRQPENVVNPEVFLLRSSHAQHHGTLGGERP